MNRTQLSQMRKRVRTLVAERAECERTAMESVPMVAASFLQRTVRPDQPKPYCYLSASIDGTSRHRYVPASQSRTWQRRAERWRQFSHAMARWVKLNREIEALLRKLGRERCVPLPPPSSPPASTPRRGRGKR